MLDIHRLRKVARLTQRELALRARISPVRVSLAECQYVRLSAKEEAAIRKAIAEAADSHAARIRNALAGADVVGGDQ
jgi:transcriptional regulator with XRE-family HTH domain